MMRFQIFNQVEKISEIKVSGSTSLDAKYKENDGLSDNEDDIYFVNKDKRTAAGYESCEDLSEQCKCTESRERM